MTSIMGLLKQVDDQDVVLPGIQRDFVWDEDQVATLLDSIMRHYPIGIALLWETYNEIQYRHFEQHYRRGMLHTYYNNTKPKRLRVVLDGQQRLQSLYIALHGKRDGKKLYLDVLSGQEWDDSEEIRYLFEFKKASEAAAENKETLAGVDDLAEDELFWWITVSDLFALASQDRRKLIKDLTKRLKLSDSLVELLQDNLDTFADVFTRDESILRLSVIDENLPSNSPERKSETDVLEIFVRINQEGTSLRRSDLIFSMLKLNWTESAESLPEFVHTINKGNSFDLDVDFVVRCLFAVSGLGGRLKIDHLRKQSNVATLQENFEQCCDAIRATVDFVQTECLCQSSRLLGNSTSLVPIVQYVFGLPMQEVPNDQIDRVRTAVYLFGLAKPFSRWGESRVGNFGRDALDARETGDIAFPLEAAIRKVQSWGRFHSLDELAESNVLLTLHLIQGLSGASVQYTRNEPEIDHIFPKSVLRQKGKTEAEIDSLANFWILARGKNGNKSNRPPKEYFAGVSKTQLKKALIDPEMLDYRRFGPFLRTRRVEMVKQLSKKIQLTEDDLRGG